MILAGIDPGSKRSAFVVLEMAKRPTLIEWALLDRVALVERLMRGGFDGLAIEAVEGVAFDVVRAADLISSSRAAGDAEGFALAMGWHHVCQSAREWRGTWLGFPTASNNAIRIAVESVAQIADGLPRLYADDRPHVYDAIGLVCASSPLFEGSRIYLPTVACLKIAEVMAAVRTKASAKRKATIARKKAA